MSTRAGRDRHTPTDSSGKVPDDGSRPNASPGEQGETPGAANRQRLQKFLAHAGVASRRHAEELITQGAVTINGRIIVELGTQVNPDEDEVRVHGEQVRLPTDYIYVMLNKPLDTLSTASDPEGRRTVLDLLPAEWRSQRIYPVGRLDWDSEGLLLLTNDGTLALHLTHPRYALTKEYHALVDGQPSPSEIRRLARGVALAGESRPTAPARVWTIGHQGDATWIGVEIHEGRNRQIRHMFEAIGYQVLRLRRTRVGPILLQDLRSGESRMLSPHEVKTLYRASGL